MSIDIRKAVENLKSQIREVPRELRSVFRDLDSYCLAKAVDIIDEKEMGSIEIKPKKEKAPAKEAKE